MTVTIFFGIVFSNLITLFFCAVLFTVVSFLWVRKLLTGFCPSIWPALVSGICNAVIGIFIELLVDEPIPAAMMTLVPLLTVVEIRLASKDRPWAYLFIFSGFLLNFGVIHDLTVVLVGLLAPGGLWLPNSLEYRVTVFSLALLAASGMQFLLLMLMPSQELSALIHDRKKSMMLLTHMLASGVVLVITSSITAPVLFDPTPVEEIRLPFLWDLFLKDLLLLACSYLIALEQCYAERAAQRNHTLDNKLQQEKKFRSTLQQQSVISYVFNVTHNRVEEGLEYFSQSLRGDPPDNYLHILRELVHRCVHPQDQQMILNQGAYLTTKEKHKEGHITQSLRFRASISALKEALNLPPAVAARYTGNQEWIWMDARATIVEDDSRGEIISYIDLVDVDEQVAQEEKLRCAALLDPLTGTYNRSALEELIRQSLSQPGVNGALIMVDMDNFKTINDSLGHAEGDALLQETARLLHCVFRADDVIGRIGGDEFCVFAVGLHEESDVNDRMQHLISSARRAHSTQTGGQIFTGLSVGVALFPEYGSDYETLYDNADIALYHAKRLGKGNFHLYSGERREAYYSDRSDL